MAMTLMQKLKAQPAERQKAEHARDVDAAVAAAGAAASTKKVMQKVAVKAGVKPKPVKKMGRWSWCRLISVES